MNPALLVRLALLISVLLIVIALGLRYKLAEAGYLLHRPGLVVRSLVAMNVIMPLIALWLVSSFDFKAPIKVALVALAISPLPPVLPGKQLKLTSHAYIYGLVVVAAICAVGFVPVSAALLSARFHTQRVSVVRVFTVVAVTLLVPLAMGLFIQRLRPARAEGLAAVFSKVGTALLIVALVPVLVLEWPTIRTLFGDGTVFAAVVLSGLGLVVGHVLGGPDPQDRTVLALATASRHPGVALVAATSAITQVPRAVPAALLLAFLVSIIVSAPYAAWRKRVHTAAMKQHPAGRDLSPS